MVLVISILSIQFTFFEDADGDGISDIQDNCQAIPNPLQSDFDLDKVGNACDSDDDNDGIVDSVDAFDENPIEWADFDYDNIGSVEDPDDDNDDILDIEDENPTLLEEHLTQNHIQEIQNCDIIDDGTGRLLCYSNFFNDLVKQEKNNSDVLNLALALSKLGAVDDCHFVSHEIGYVGFEENPNVIEILRDVDSTICRGGYYHGVMTAYFHDAKENNKSLPEYKDICNDLIGSSDYQDCIHGLGHGLVHFYQGDLTASTNSCHQMSFYQSSLCVGGTMMQYTDEQLTRNGLTANNISKMCTSLNLSSLDYQQCNVSLGLSLAYHTNHDLEKGKSFCEMISDEKGKSFCLYGFEGEIKNAQEYKVSPITKETREIFQPQWTKQGSIIDFRSPAIISNFVYDENIKIIQFSFNKPSYIIMYIPNNLLSEKYMVVVNGLVLQSTMIDTQSYKDYTMIRIQPESAGIVLITTL
ncbi:MAG: thrombospondin type 3 repeat-containing protein [Nitrosopumilales archaeon]|nr:thrombospondin type 3 repeat-containing protein [Nitrosopumilales archaeon]